MISESRCGRMESANREIRASLDQLEAEHRTAWRLRALLERTDAMLTELETLNLLEVRRIPEALRFDLIALVANVPFEFTARIGLRPSPTIAIDMVFDIQEGLFRLMRGMEVDTETHEESARVTVPLDLNSLAIHSVLQAPATPGGLQPPEVT